METGKFVTFAVLIGRLQALATNLAGRKRDPPQPEISVIDVSGVKGRTATRPGIRPPRVKRD